MLHSHAHRTIDDASNTDQRLPDQLLLRPLSHGRRYTAPRTDPDFERIEDAEACAPELNPLGPRDDVVLLADVALEEVAKSFVCIVALRLLKDRKCIERYQITQMVSRLFNRDGPEGSADGHCDEGWYP